MQNKNSISDFYQFSKTVDERVSLMSEIDSLLTASFSSDEGAYRNCLQQSVREPVAEMIKSFAGSDPGIRLKELKTVISNLVVVRIVTAFWPSEELTQKIWDMFTGSLGSGLVISFEVDPEIIAGAKFYWQGKYEDFSVQKLLSEQSASL